MIENALNFYHCSTKSKIRGSKSSFAVVMVELAKVLHLTHFCYLIRLVFDQHLNSHRAYPGIPPKTSSHTREQCLHLPSYPLLRLF